MNDDTNQPPEPTALSPSPCYTPFAKKVVEYLQSCDRLTDQTTWKIAKTCFPEKWVNRRCRGALIVQIRNLTRYPTIGWVPPSDRWGEGTLFLYNK